MQVYAIYLICYPLYYSSTPIYKSGSRELVTNYRPISLLCIVSKVLERLVYNKVMPFLFHTFSTHQFGFLPKRSTLQQLLLVLNIIHKAIHFSNKRVDILYLDFRKAFDSVSHCKLLNKLWSVESEVIFSVGLGHTLTTDICVCVSTSGIAICYQSSQGFLKEVY